MLADDFVQNSILVRPESKMPINDVRIDIRTPSSKLLAQRTNVTSVSKHPVTTSCSSRKSIKIVKPETIKRARDDAFMAASIGDLDWLKQTLQITSDLVFDKNGYSTLHLAAIHARLNIIKYLIEEKKMNVNLPSLIQLWRPIHLCISAQNGSKAIDCLVYLIDKGADINLTNADNQGCLHIAATEGQLECIKILLELNADTTIKDVRGQSALDLARLWGHRLCAKYLSDDLWHVTKKVLAEQIELEKKLEAQNVLLEAEKAHQIQYETEQESSRNFDKWLMHQGFLSETTDFDNLLSHRSQLHNQSLHEKNISTEDVSFAAESPRATTKLKKFAKISIKTDPVKTKPIDGKQWNHSTKPNKPEYVPNLDDFYPRDQYTFLPKDLDLMLVSRELKGMSLEQVKEFMRKKIDLSNVHLDSYDSTRPGYFKPKHVLDAQSKSKQEQDQLNDEAGLNMCDDIRSFQFQEAKNYIVNNRVQPKIESFYGKYYNTNSTLKAIKDQLKPQKKDDKLDIIEKFYGKELSNYMRDKRHNKMSQKYEKVFIC